MLQPGRYRQYKGPGYEVVGVATLSEIVEEFVVYRALYGRGDLWIRPLSLFLEPIMSLSATVPKAPGQNRYIDAPRFQ